MMQSDPVSGQHVPSAHAVLCWTPSSAEKVKGAKAAAEPAINVTSASLLFIVGIVSLLFGSCKIEVQKNDT